MIVMIGHDLNRLRRIESLLKAKLGDDSPNFTLIQTQSCLEGQLPKVLSANAIFIDQAIINDHGEPAVTEVLVIRLLKDHRCESPIVACANSIITNQRMVIAGATDSIWKIEDGKLFSGVSLNLPMEMVIKGLLDIIRKIALKENSLVA